jgi:DNA-binding MarR family transcriptional regulator
MQKRMMETLSSQCGHTRLRLGFAPYITLIGTSGRRLSDLADLMRISRQACNQTIKQIEAAGYIERRSDPADARAKRLVLSARGIELRRDGARVVSDMDKLFANIAGEQAYARTAKAMAAIHRHLELGVANEDIELASYQGLGGLLPTLTDYIHHRLMELTRQKGHPALKLSFGQVLTLIGPGGGRIQHIASVQDVSKQAISAIATELEALGYLRREPDPGDARQVVLHFTTEGDRLIADSVASVIEVEKQFSAIAGKAEFAVAKDTFQKLHAHLCTEHTLHNQTDPVELGRIANRLHQQLGADACAMLAEMLARPAGTTR